jgi:hypothetical protein
MITFSLLMIPLLKIYFLGSFVIFLQQQPQFLLLGALSNEQRPL